MRNHALGAAVALSALAGISGIAGCGSESESGSGPPCDGCMIVESPFTRAEITSIAVDRTGGIVAAVTSTTGGFAAHIARMDRDGVLDPSFGTGGILSFEQDPTPQGGVRPRFANAYAIAVMSDGAIRIAGQAERSAGPVVLGATPAGRDDGFRIYNEFGKLDFSTAVGVALMEQAGALVVAYGGADLIDRWVENLARYTPAGALDPSFTPVAAESAVAIAPDGGIVMGSGDYVNGADQFVVRRVARDGKPDPRFGAGNPVAIPVFPMRQRSVAVAPSAVTPGGMIIAGVGIEDGQRGLLVARLDATGQLDASFGGRGYVLHDVIGAGDVQAIAEAPDGGIVVVGTAENRAHHFGSFAAATRLLRDGSLDPAFGEGGVVVARAELSAFRSVVVLPDGDIVAAGRAEGVSTTDSIFAEPLPLFARFPAAAAPSGSFYRSIE